MLRIGIVGDYQEGYEPHPITDRFFTHAAERLGIHIDKIWLPTDQVTPEALREFHALWISPGSPYRSLDGALAAIRFAREESISMGGACAGFQHIILEYARNVLGITDAQHEEYDPPAGSRLLLARLVCTVAGKELPITLAEGSLAATAYGRTKISEHYYCSFGLNPEYRERLGALRVTGWDDANEARVIELPSDAFSVATLFVPRSTPDSPHPLALAFLRSAHDRARIQRPARAN